MGTLCCLRLPIQGTLLWTLTHPHMFPPSDLLCDAFLLQRVALPALEHPYCTTHHLV